MFIWCAGLAALVGVGAQAWSARVFQAAWSPPWLVLSYLCGAGGLALRTGSLAESLTIVAIGSATLVVASGGHVERLEDQEWKGAEAAERPALKRRQRWVITRWVSLLVLFLRWTPRSAGSRIVDEGTLRSRPQLLLKRRRFAHT